MPEERTVTLGEVICVSERSFTRRTPKLLARNSVTRPATRTASPTATRPAAELPKTNRPSDVAGSASGVESWSQKLEERLTVTIPSMPETVWLT